MAGAETLASAWASAQTLLRDCALPTAEARTLLAHCVGVNRERLIAHPEYPIDERTQALFARLAVARQQGTPMAYLVGAQEFYGHRVRVTPEVLIPRPETELLVQTGLGLLDRHANARVLELGTGSGCVAIALALQRPDLWVVATDRSVAALCVARQNALDLGATVQFLAADWYAPLQGRFDLVLSNPPYVHAADEHLWALRYEPRVALTDESDGLSALRIVVAGARGRLASGGRLLLEHGFDQADAVREMMQDHGLVHVQTLRDLAGQERCCLGQCPG